MSWCWGFLGAKIRVVIPACAVVRIRQEWPDPEGHYVGYTRAGVTRAAAAAAAAAAPLADVLHAAAPLQVHPVLD